MFKRLTSICLFALLTYCSFAWCEPQWCVGTVSYLWSTYDGSVLMFGSWRNDHTKVCNLSDIWNGISPKTCAGWYATLHTALVLRSNVTIFYDDAPTCSTLPVYSFSPRPFYVMTDNTR